MKQVNKKLTTEEIKQWDDALLDLVNKGLIEIMHLEDGTVGFKLIEKGLNLKEIKVMNTTNE